MRSALLRLSPALAAAFALAACLGDAAGPSEFPPGSVAFRYVRADTAGRPLGDTLSFTAEGAVTTDNYFTGTYAFGLRDTSFSDSTAVRVYGQQAQDDDTYDGLLLFVADPAVGTYECTAATPPLNCRFAASFTVGSSQDELASTPSVRVGARGGRVTITAIDGQRVRGTFSLQMRGTVDDVPDAALRITNGTFDVPLTSADTVSIRG